MWDDQWNHKKLLRDTFNIISVIFNCNNQKHSTSTAVINKSNDIFFDIDNIKMIFNLLSENIFANMKR